jgi:hypothetical protein
MPGCSGAKKSRSRSRPPTRSCLMRAPSWLLVARQTGQDGRGHRLTVPAGLGSGHRLQGSAEHCAVLWPSVVGGGSRWSHAAARTQARALVAPDKALGAGKPGPCSGPRRGARGWASAERRVFRSPKLAPDTPTRLGSALARSPPRHSRCVTASSHHSARSCSHRRPAASAAASVGNVCGLTASDRPPRQ